MINLSKQHDPPFNIRQWDPMRQWEIQRALANADIFLLMFGLLLMCDN